MNKNKVSSVCSLFNWAVKNIKSMDRIFEGLNNVHFITLTHHIFEILLSSKTLYRFSSGFDLRHALAQVCFYFTASYAANQLVSPRFLLEIFSAFSVFFYSVLFSLFSFVLSFFPLFYFYHSFFLSVFL